MDQLGFHVFVVLSDRTTIELLQFLLVYVCMYLILVPNGCRVKTKYNKRKKEKEKETKKTKEKKASKH